MKRVFAVLLLAIVAGAALALLAPKETAARMTRAELAGLALAYDSALARDDVTAEGGPSDRLAFLVSFPGFGRPSANNGQAIIQITLTPVEDGADPQERPSRLYARFLTPETLAGPNGLVLRQFEPDSPYESEELFLAPPDGRAFFARCPKAQLGAPGEGCLSVFREKTVDIELRYPPELLEHWDALYEGARDLLVRIQRPRVKSGG
jgi:hypothetical protein